MVRQWFSVSAVLAVATLLIASDASQARERRYSRRARRHSENVVMANTQTAMAPQGEMRQSFYSGPGAAPVLVTLRVPAQAEILFDGAKTTQQGALRTYVSPPIDPQRHYHYDVTAKWMEEGKERSQTRKIMVHAGERLTVDLTKPADEKAKETK